MTDATNPSDVADIAAKLENTNISSTAASSTTDTNKASPANDTKATPNKPTDVAQPTEAKTEETTNNTSPQQPQQAQAVNPSTSATTTGQVSTTKGGVSENKEAEEDLTNLIINYLPPTMSEGTLATLFSPYGLLERCKIVVDLQTLRSRGYGFVKYDNPTSAQRALSALNGYELNGKKLKVAYARKQCKAITNANLYITNIPQHINDDDLRKLFQDYGKIVECRVLKDQNGQSRGVGFVRMGTHHDAIQALQAMDQYVIDDNHPPLLVKLAQRRVPRRYWNAQNRNQGGGMNQGGMGRQQQNKGGGFKGKHQQKRKKKNSPNRQYYSPKGSGQGGMNMGDNMVQGLSGGGQGGQGQNQRTPNKGGRGGYYRPRNQQKVGGGYNNNRGGGGGGGGVRGPNQGPTYFPAPMYDAHPPYQQMAASYGQPAYAANIPMTAAALNNPAGVGAGGSAVTSTNNKESSPPQFNVLVYNLPKHFTVDHIINLYAKFGPVQSVNIRNSVHSYPNKKGPVGIISYFYFDDAQRAQNETNNLEMTVGKRLQTIFQPPAK